MDTGGHQLQVDFNCSVGHITTGKLIHRWSPDTGSLQYRFVCPVESVLKTACFKQSRLSETTFLLLALIVIDKVHVVCIAYTCTHKLLFVMPWMYMFGSKTTCIHWIMCYCTNVASLFHFQLNIRVGLT